MAVKVDPNLMKELKHFGLKDASKCFHCGNCTAVCPLSEPDNPFPRRLVKYAQMGLKDKILQAPEPWLCYYCGDCSDRCPRGADPGETMMALRRYLTAQYDLHRVRQKILHQRNIRSRGRGRGGRPYRPGLPHFPRTGHHRSRRFGFHGRKRGPEYVRPQLDY